MDKIHVIGDSHVHFFSGEQKLIHHSDWTGNIPNFTVMNMACYAYNFARNHRVPKLVDEIIETIAPTPIIFTYGELDCRLQLLKQSKKQLRSLREVISECVIKYFTRAKDMAQTHGCIPIFWGPPPSGPITYGVDHFGTIEEMNSIKRYFNVLLEQLCSVNDIPFITVFYKMIEGGIADDEEYYFDGSHVSQILLPYILNLLSDKGFQIEESLGEIKDGG